jgi:hypothetical protein
MVTGCDGGHYTQAGHVVKMQDACARKNHYDSGFRVQRPARTGAVILDLLRHVRIGPAAIMPRQLLLSRTLAT